MKTVQIGDDQIQLTVCMSLAEAAQLLGTTYQTAHRWVLTGRLRGLKVAGRWVADGDDVARLAAERRAK
jgi:excisionase family DNA binding protein